MFDLRTLGGLQLTGSDGAPLPRIAGRERRLALLVYLASGATPGPSRRDTLAALFWPESPTGRARTALRQALKILRGGLGPEALVSVGDAVAVSPAQVSCDAVRFEAALDRGQLAEALALYRGDFLAGFFIEGSPDFEDWASARRAELRGRAASAARRLAAEAERAGELEAAARWAQRALELAPDDEGVVEQLGRALRGAGRSAEAAVRFRDFAGRLRAGLDLATPAPLTSPELPERGALSVGVLPLANLTGDPELEYLADGLTEELIAGLARLRGLWVPARTSSFAFKGRAVHTRQLGEALGVRYLVEGSLRLLEGVVRVTATLVQAHDGDRVWSAQLDQPLSELMALPSEIISRLTAGLSSRLAVRFDSRGSRAAASSPPYLAFLRGMHHFARKSPADLHLAIACFRSALAADPGYAAAWAGLARALGSLTVYAGVAPGECLPEARLAAERCIALDPHIADGHSVLGVIRAMFDQDWEGALAALERSVVLDPWEPTARTALALYGYSPRGRHDEARRHAEHALELDPLSLPCLAYLASVASFGGDHQRAATLCRQALELDPGFVLALWNLLTAREQLGALEEALELAQRLVASTQGSPVMRAHLARLLARTGRVGQARTLLASLESRAPGRADYWYATGWLALGDRARALEALEQAEASRSNFLVFTAVEPGLAGLRSEPRFRALLRRLRLDDVRAV